MDPMMEAFISESRENLETAGRCFLELESHPTDTELLNDVFRAMHTIKGSSGLFDIPAFTKVVHAAEDVLDAVRSGEFELNAEHIDLFLDTMDQVSNWLDQLETNESLDDDAESYSQTQVKLLRALLVDDNSDNQIDEAETQKTSEPVSDTSSSIAETKETTETVEWLNHVPQSLCQKWYQTLDNLMAIAYQPDEQCFFTGDDPLHTVLTLPGLQWFDVQTKEAWPEPLELDPYRCNLDFYIIADGQQNALANYFRYVPEQVSMSPISKQQLIMVSGEMGDAEQYERFLDDAQTQLASKNWSGLLQRVQAQLQISGAGLAQTSALNWLAIILQEAQPDERLVHALIRAVQHGQLEMDAEDNVTSVDTLSTQPQTTQMSQVEQAYLDEAMQPVLTAQQELLRSACPESLFEGRIISVAHVLSNVFNLSGVSTEGLEDQVQQSLESHSSSPLLDFIREKATELGHEQQPGNASEQPLVSKNQQKSSRMETATGQTGQRENVSKPATSGFGADNTHKVLKVDQQRIDALMDLVGEMIVAKNALPFLARKAENEYGIRELAKDIKTQYGVINRLTEELQSTVMQIRMVPVASVFQRFPRLVRDLSRKLNKKIRLVMEGEDTEADKNVVESLADPLIHLIRNSLDHGLETASEREQAGKPIEGTIILRAIPKDDQVIIEIVDDGRGIDPDKIKRKAYEKGVIDEQQLDSITDQEALQLIFAAGLSTAEQVSDLSGRGVGMDVVCSVVKQAGGHVTVESVLGKGTTIRLGLPLSMAISRIMMVEVASQSYGIAMENIVETVRIPASDIQKIKHRDVFVLRERLIPLFYLRTLLQLAEPEHQPEEVAVLVMTIDGEEVGLVIDEFHEGLDIIQKPLEGVMASYPWYVGAALLGDGRVLLVLNIRELIQCR